MAKDYAIGLYFDDMSDKYFTDIMLQIAQKGVNSYMLDTKIPPHITLSCFQTDDIGTVLSVIGGNQEILRSDNIFWSSIAAFVPKVLYAAPVFSEYLRGLNTRINELVKDISTPSNHNRYLPNCWVPHTALAVKMELSGLIKAFETAASIFTAFGGRAEKLFIAECEPFKEISVLQLK